MENSSVFSERLRELMFDKKISVENLSEFLGINLSLIYKYFRKEFFPSTINAIKLADYFHCSLDFLFGLTNDYQEKSFSSSKSFAECFQKILHEKSYTRYRVKKETKLAKQSIDDWFHGVRLPNIENLIIMAQYFDCSLDYLVGRES